ncbi:MAG: gfo/Idh/MocA family oxidoreductase [Acidobacteria bacterium]|nr:MAG: gfo/Idh/MocA family oxidoreductase [Acidobacteriota bacterium]
MQDVNRRKFLKASSASLVGASLMGTSARWAGANDRIRVAVLGLGGRGRGHIREASANQGVEVVALCDPDRKRLETAAAEHQKAAGVKARCETDLRRILEDKEIDVVSVATTNHWHALATIWACQAGKHVYVEKPVSHNLAEGRKMIEAARKYKRFVATGTQRRSNGSFRKVMELLHGGVIGDIYLARCEYPQPRPALGFKQPEPPPSWLEWDLWLGPAPQQPYHANLVHYNWHWFWDFGNGEIGNNGPHFLDILRWGMRKGLPVRVQSVGGRFGEKDQAQTPNTQRTTMVYEDGSELVNDIRGVFAGEGFSWDFFGSKGYMHLNYRHLGTSYGCTYEVFLGRSKTPEPNQGEYPDVEHYSNFITALRAGKPELLNADITEGHLSAGLCHLANISYRVGRELRFDPKTERFVGDEEANRLLDCRYRKPFAVPEKV